MNVKLRCLLLVTFDTLLVSLVIILAYLLHFDFKVDMETFVYIPYVIAMHLVVIFFVFNKYRIYKRAWQYASIGELITIIKAVFITEIVLFLFHEIFTFFNYNFVIPRSIYLISGSLLILAIGGSRLLWRIYRDNYLKIQKYHKPAIIVGAGDAGVLLAKELKHLINSETYPVAFIDDDINKQNLEVLGIPVVGTRKDIPKKVKELNIQKIIIATPSIGKSELAELVEICNTTKINTQILPAIKDIVNGKVKISMLRNVEVEDLLGRDPIELNISEIDNYIKNKVVLVSGGGGSIGSELCRQILNFSPRKLLILDHSENNIYDIELELNKRYRDLDIVPLIADVQQKKRIDNIFKSYKPDVIFHAAAHKHVPLMESSPIEAIKNNVFGTKNMAECADRYDASHFVMISTDKAVNPTSVMGTTKRIAEMIIQYYAQTSKTKFTAVRFGNVLGSRGSVIPLFKKQIAEGGPITVTDPNMVRFFMTIPEAVQLVIQSGGAAKGGEIFILDMGEQVKIADLANDLIKLSGLEPNVDIKVEYIGVRPGEKLYEEILTEEEGIVATKYNRIFISGSNYIDKDELFYIIKKLEQLLFDNVEVLALEKTKKILSEIVPTYKYKETLANKIDDEKEVRMAK